MKPGKKNKKRKSVSEKELDRRLMTLKKNIQEEKNARRYQRKDS